MEEAEQLAVEIDFHMLALLRSDSKQATAIAWMKSAYLLLERAAAEIRKPKIFAVPGSYGVPTFMITPPKQLVLPPGFKPNPPIWIGGKTVIYGDKYMDHNFTRPWTPKDGRRLEKERAKQRAKQTRERELSKK